MNRLRTHLIPLLVSLPLTLAGFLTLTPLVTSDGVGLLLALLLYAFAFTGITATLTWFEYALSLTRRK